MRSARIATPQTPPTTPPTIAPVFVDEPAVVDEEVEVEVEVKVEVEVADEVVGATVGVAMKVLLSAPFLGNIQYADPESTRQAHAQEMQRTRAIYSHRQRIHSAIVDTTWYRAPKEPLCGA